MTTRDPFAVPVGWRRAQREGVLTATGPGQPPARLEWRCGRPPAYDALVVEDEDRFDLAGHEVDYRRLGHRCDGIEMVSEEWTWRTGAIRGVLTGTVARDDYLAVCDLFDEVATTVDPVPMTGFSPR